MEAANLLNFHPLGRSKSYHGGFINFLFKIEQCIHCKIELTCLSKSFLIS